mgnify:CR=1 FL=1
MSLISKILSLLLVLNASQAWALESDPDQPINIDSDNAVYDEKQQTSTYATINGQLVFTEAPPAGSSNIELTYMGERVLVNPYLSADTFGIVRVNASTLTENVSITTGYNASSAGPLTLANNVTVTVANNSTWTIF